MEKTTTKTKKSYPGINIQWPISELILSGEKTIETRTYKIPDKYIGVEMVLIETPGPKGKFKARTRAIIKFTECFKYKNSKEFYADFESHLVDKNSPWAWTDAKPKWGWRVEVVRKSIGFKTLNQKTGIIYTQEVSFK